MIDGIPVTGPSISTKRTSPGVSLPFFVINDLLIIYGNIYRIEKCRYRAIQGHYFLGISPET